VRSGGVRPLAAALEPPGTLETPGTMESPEVVEVDVLVVGAGAAGLTAALGCAAGGPRTTASASDLAPQGVGPSSHGGVRRVVVLTKTRSSGAGAGGASVWAQGGVASAVGDDDDPALHAADTLAAGAGLNDAAIVGLLTGDGPARVRSLLALGARFDRDPGGRLALGREGAHSRRRILHAHGDATGAEVVRTLVQAVHREPSIRVVDETFALDLALEAGAVAGLLALQRDGRRVLYRAPAVVLATGGLGQLFLHTTNPREATADGLAMAARAGARLVDLEFVQFHPTALAVQAPDAEDTAGAGAAAGAPLPLLTEALRGEGAVLVDDRGVRFMAAVHPDRELAPRDVVARAIWAQLAAGRRVYLDATRAVGERFPERFPTVFALCRQHGLDPRVEPLPVVPAAHYHMGGVAVDARGRTSLPGLWACGEVAATGAHGANRLASNSLLEALVFGARVAEDVEAVAAAAAASAPPMPAAGAGAARLDKDLEQVAPALGLAAAGAEALLARLRRLMWERVGVERDEAGLTTAVAELAALSRRPAAALGAAVDRLPRPEMPSPAAAGFAAAEARNLLLAGRLLAQAALARRESRGGHYRVDHPRADAAWQRRLFLTATPAGTARFEAREAGVVSGAAMPAPAAEPVPLTAAATVAIAGTARREPVVAAAADRRRCVAAAAVRRA
jgi:L-aspartate oxidase